MNRLFHCIAALTAGLVSASALQDKPWRIGALYPLTGNLAVLGNENLVGARFAVEMINETGGVDGRPVELVTGDASTPDKAQSEAERLSSLAGLQVITGAYSSGPSYAASRVIERRGGLYWEPAASPTD